MFDLDDAIFAITDHRGDIHHTNLIEAVFNNNINAVKSYLEKPEYSSILDSESFEFFTPLAVALNCGHMELVKLLCDHTNPNHTALKALFESGQEISQIIHMIDYMNTRLEHDELSEILNSDILKKKIAYIDSRELLDHLFKNYKLNFTLSDGSSLLFVAHNPLETMEDHLIPEKRRGKPYQNTIDFIESTGFDLSDFERYLLQIIAFINQKDIEKITQLLKHSNVDQLLQKNIQVTELIFSKLLSSFTYEQASEALKLMTKHIDTSYLICRLTYLSFKRTPKNKEDIIHKAILLTEAYETNVKDSNVGTGYSANKFFSHILGLKGEVLSAFGNSIESLEGSTVDNSLVDIICMLKQYDKQPNDVKYKPHLKEIEKAFCRAFCATSSDDQEIHEVIHKRSLEDMKVVIIPARSTKHVFGITLIKKDEDTYYVSLSNRGESTTFNGSLVYEINQTMAHQIIHNFTSISSQEYKSQKQCNDIFFDIIGRDNQPIKKLPANTQKYGTCAFVNPKRCIETALYLIGLQNDKDDLKIEANQIYKSFSEFTRDKGIELLCSKIKRNPTSNSLQQLAITYITLHYPQQNSKHRIKQLLEVLPSDTAKILEHAIEGHKFHDKYILVQSIDQIQIAETTLNICQLSGVIDHVMGVQVEGDRIKINTVSNREKKYEVLKLFESIANPPAISQTLFQSHPIENVRGQYEFYFKFQKPEYLASLLMQVEKSSEDPKTQQKSEP